MPVSPVASAARFSGSPGALRASVELLTTAGTSYWPLFSPVVKLAASLPESSWIASSSLPELGSV